MLHKVSFILSCLLACLAVLCVLFPEWVIADVYEAGVLTPKTAGLFYMCTVGNGSLRWVNCERGLYIDMSWYQLVQALYMMAIILLVLSVPVHYKSMSSTKGRLFRYRAATTTFAFVTLGLQLVTIGLYGDHYESQSWCMLRYSGGQRTVCTSVLNYPGETVALGWTYWIAMVTTIMSGAHMILDYMIMNEEVELS